MKDCITVDQNGRNSYRLTNFINKMDCQLFKETDPRHEMISRILEKIETIHDDDLNKTLVEKIAKSIKTIKFCEKELEIFKAEVLRFSPVIFDKYADLLAIKIKELNSNKVVIVSYGSGINGHIERNLQERIQPKVGDRQMLRFVGLDTYRPTDFSGSFFDKDNFYLLNKNDKSEIKELIELGNDEKLIVIANYVLHHQDSSLQEFIKRCADAPTFILDEPVDRSKWGNKNFRFAVIAHDMLANVAINPKWAKVFLVKPEEFYVNYLFKDELDKVGKLNLFFENAPISSLTII